MTSQRWLNDTDFAANSESGSIWWHYLAVIVPDNVKSTTNASLWITGGNMGQGAPSIHSEDILVSAALAVSNGVVVGSLFMVPNEHTVFAADPIQKSRTEDSIIAYTWDHFLKDPSQPEWLVRFPMVKASLRAMDAVSEFAAKKFPTMNYKLDYYAVAGASKRGWTTWLVGAVDPDRVMLIVPVVLDAVNFINVEHHQYRSYGGWSWALSDYTDMDIMERLDDPNMLLLAQNEDPYYFFDRLTMPKLIVNAALDEFQQPDDTHYWWADLPEPKHFIMTPNAEHSEATGILEIVPAICAWYAKHLQLEKVPEFTWTINNSTGEIVVTLDEHGIVYEANVYWAYSCGNNAADGVMRRDFRIANLDNPCKCGVAYDGYCSNFKSLWSKQQLEEKTVRGHRTYSAVLDAPTDGRWIAYFIDVTYRSHLHDVPSATSKREEADALDAMKREGIFPKDLAFRLEFTSEVSVFPDTFPYAACQGSGCKGYLL
jgi:PhoPQ-activated pathogenicity-related protein